MRTNWLVLLALAAVIGLPFALRRSGPDLVRTSESARRLIIVTPHNESIRREFGQAFAAYEKRAKNREVIVDWRVIGGTSEIAKYLESEYKNSFRLHWERDLKKVWSNEVQKSFNNRKFDKTKASPEAIAARDTFLASDVSIGVDLFFGGGQYDFSVQGGMGHLVASGLRKTRPEWFGPAGIPEKFRGEVYWDKDDRYYGTALSSFGLIFNRPALGRLGVPEPRAWRDLADPRLFRQVAVCDPTKSGSMAKAFEMIVQQEMRKELNRLRAATPGADPKALETQALTLGWANALGIIQRIAANARYFTDSASKPSLDVSLGDCAVGMSIDFYGRFQEESVLARSKGDRFGFYAPPDGTSYSADPVGLFRGAPSKDLAEEFIEFTLSPEGQKLWNHKVGTPGGPTEFALRRPPIRPDAYGEPTLTSDPAVRPYDKPADGSEPFVYESTWTREVFNPLRFLIRVACVDTQLELREAWEALIANNFPPEATARFGDLNGLSLDEVKALGKALESGQKIDEAVKARELTLRFRDQYREAARLAREKR